MFHSCYHDYFCSQHSPEAPLAHTPNAYHIMIQRAPLLVNNV